TWNQLLAVIHERVGSLGRRFLFDAVQSIAQRHALAAQNDGTDGNALLFPVQVRNGERGLKRTDSASLRVPRQKLDDVVAWQQREAGLILYRTLRELAGSVVTELDIQLVSHVLYGDPVVVFHLADEIDHRVPGPAAPGQRQLAAGDLDGHRHEVLRGVELEVVHLHGNRDIRDRVLQHQRLLELTL